MAKATFPIYHTSALLRKHKLLVKQAGMKTKDFSLVDWSTYRRAARKRWDAYFNELEAIDQSPCNH